MERLDPVMESTECSTFSEGPQLGGLQRGFFDASGLEESEGEESDDAGSLVDFVVEDDGEECDDGSSVASEAPATREEALARDLDGISAANIVPGKRVRRATQFYEREVFQTAEYRRMMLCDVPADEMHAVQQSDAESENSGEESDAEYVAHDDEADDDDEDGD